MYFRTLADSTLVFDQFLPQLETIAKELHYFKFTIVEQRRHTFYHCVDKWPSILMQIISMKYAKICTLNYVMIQNIVFSFTNLWETIWILCVNEQIHKITHKQLFINYLFFMFTFNMFNFFCNCGDNSEEVQHIYRIDCIQIKYMLLISMLSYIWPIWQSYIVHRKSRILLTVKLYYLFV